MKRQSAHLGIRISHQLQGHLIGLGELSPVVRAVLVLGLDSLGHDCTDLFRDIAGAYGDRSITDPELLHALDQLLRKWSGPGLFYNFNAVTPTPFTALEWEALCIKYDHKCLACGQQLPLTPDHILPTSKGGSQDIDNIQPLCFPCNRRKGDRCIDYRKGQSE